MKQQNSLIALIAVALLMTGCTKENTTVPVHKDLEGQYFYKVGTWWKYYNMVDMHTEDSFVVSSAEKTTVNTAAEPTIYREKILVYIDQYHNGRPNGTFRYVIKMEGDTMYSYCLFRNGFQTVKTFEHQYSIPSANTDLSSILTDRFYTKFAFYRPDNNQLVSWSMMKSNIVR